MPLVEPLNLPTDFDEDISAIDPPDNIDDDDGDDPDRDPSKWITIATFWQPTEAHIARLKLESEEIDCLLIDENLVATDWLYANAVGGIKLRVPEEDAEQARRILTRPMNRLDDGDSVDTRACKRGPISRVPLLILLFVTAIVLMAILVTI